MQTLVLLRNETATGASQKWTGGRAQLHCACAGYNGATVKLQILGPDGSTWLDVANGSFTANGIGNVELPMFAEVRMAVITATPSSGVYATLYERAF